MINEERNKTQNDAPIVAFYDMRAVMFVLLNEMVDVSITGLQLFILIPRLNHTRSHRPNPIYIDKKYRIWNKNHSTCCNPTNYEESSRTSLILVASYDMPQRKAEVLFYTVKTPREPMGTRIWIK